MDKIHDKTVKERLSVKENAIAFLGTALPSDVRAMLDLDTLIFENKSYVNDELKELFVDLVYSCKLKGKGELYTSILIEHKSYKDKYTVFQILSYLASGYASQIKQGERLKIIIPVIFSHNGGEGRPISIEEYFGDYPSILKRYIPSIDTILFDVNDLTDDEIGMIRNLAIETLLLTQKYGPQDIKLLFGRLQKLFETLKTEEERNKYFVCIRYAIVAYIKNKSELAEIKDLISEPINQIAMSVVIEYYEEGVEKGIGIGVEKGIGIGVEDNKIVTAILLFREGQSIDFISKITQFSPERILNILREKNMIQ
jgi:predicted transposase/invertase (TIGR01784 family)